MYTLCMKKQKADFQNFCEHNKLKCRGCVLVQESAIGIFDFIAKHNLRFEDGEVRPIKQLPEQEIMGMTELATLALDEHNNFLESEDSEWNDDPTSKVDPYHALIFSQILMHLPGEGNIMGNFLGFISWRNFCHLDKREEEGYGWASGIYHTTKWADIVFAADNREDLDPTFLEDAIQCIIYMLQDFRFAEHNLSSKIANSLTESFMFTLEDFMFRILNSIPENQVIEGIKFASIIFDDLSKQAREGMLNLSPDAAFRFHHAFAQLMIGKAMMQWSIKTATTENLSGEQIELMKKVQYDPKNIESTTELIAKAYQNLTRAANYAQTNLNDYLRKAKIELEIAHVWYLFSGLDFSEFAELHHLEEHFGRAKDIFSRANYELGVTVCDRWWAYYIDDKTEYDRLANTAPPLHVFFAKCELR
jgi:hypothetical protein